MRYVAGMAILVVCAFLAVETTDVFAWFDRAGADYHPSETVEADVDAVLARAKTEGKLAFVALGANWCHDSRGLAKKLKSDDLRGVVSEHYIPILVDVGFYGDGIKIAQKFGRPTIYSTPTVLIIDPETGVQVNEAVMHRWSHSAAMPVEEMAEHLVDLAKTAQGTEAADLTDVQRTALEQIRAFEARVSKRITRGFAVVGPVLEAKTNDESVDLDEVWSPLSRLRNRLMDDVTELHAKVLAHEGSSPIRLEFPEYEALPWE